jgi:hypothetical protein
MGFWSRLLMSNRSLMLRPKLAPGGLTGMLMAPLVAVRPGGGGGCRGWVKALTGTTVGRSTRLGGAMTFSTTSSCRSSTFSSFSSSKGGISNWTTSSLGWTTRFGAGCLPLKGLMAIR